MEVTMGTQEREIRCRACRILLGKLGEHGLTIQRGDLQATIDGEFRASLVCYRRRCRTLNILRLPAAPRPPVEAA